MRQLCEVYLRITSCDVIFIIMLILVPHTEPPEPPPPAAPRALHILDVENLAGGPDFTAAGAEALRRQYEVTVGIGPDDLVVIATSHHAAPSAWFAWPQARRLVRSGADGADLALIEVLDRERIADRFETVIVASGDGIFAEPCSRLQAEGRRVTVVAKPGTLSRRLAFAVRDHITLFVDGISSPARVLRRAG